MRQLSHHRAQHGIIMIEVLVALIVLALGILGLAGLQVYSLKNSQSAYARSIASDLANDLAERVRANRTPELAGNPQIKVASEASMAQAALPPDYPAFNCGDNASGVLSCTAPSDGHPGNTLASKELASWMRLVRASLPVGDEGGGLICRDDDITNGVDVPDAADHGGPIYDSSDSEYEAKTGCLAPTNARYAQAPLVIKIWWQDLDQSGKRVAGAPLQLFSTPLGDNLAALVVPTAAPASGGAP
ncbi:hypothetical protein GCM10007860_01490 [Chitiniphilus shinanonensis]|uniref:Type IV pilus modification protein PilV n=1 Tax=Chitiniphilus shinanonensis TaxID=553088 RepID=A0ABQ6BMA5_9NEIS|nr:type IV pilus modification protein PilV [Chitiniphilus shinanonensis]GLS03006.1 hypothetical protein GCM10007860_01490 [Chitiniphilus shinanonensis]